MKKIKLIAILIIFVNSFTLEIKATSDGKGTEYFIDNVSIKNNYSKLPKTQLDVNGSMIIFDGSQNINYILRSDKNGLASWVPISYYPNLNGNNGSFNHLDLHDPIIYNGKFLNLLTVESKLNFPNVENGYILAIDVNGQTQWVQNYGAGGESNDRNWIEKNNTIFPKSNGGAMNLAIGENGFASADIYFSLNGEAFFNKQQNTNEEIIVKSKDNTALLQTQVNQDRIGLGIASPQARLDINGMLAIRATGTDYLTAPDNNSSVIWLAKNSTVAANGALLVHINSDSSNKIFNLLEYASENGIKTQNGIYLTDLAANKLVKTNANKELISEDTISLSTNGIGINTDNVEANLQVGNGIVNHIDGTNDILVEQDLEADGTIYAENFEGESLSGLWFNGITLMNPNIYTSTIYETMTLNGNAEIKPLDGTLYIDAHLESKGNINQKTKKVFQLKGSPNAINDYITLHASNGQVGINTQNPQANFDINGSLMITNGFENNGYVLAAKDSNGLAQWKAIEFIALEGKVNQAQYVQTAHYADSLVNGEIFNGNFIGGTVNGATLKNIDFTETLGLRKWQPGADGLYPTDTNNANVLIAGDTTNNAGIILQSNGSVIAKNFYGDFSGIINKSFNEDWVEADDIFYPKVNNGVQSIYIGADNYNDAGLVIGHNGMVLINKNKTINDTIFHSQNEENLFYIDASSSRVGINQKIPRRQTDINGSIAYKAQALSLDETGINGSLINSRLVYLDNLSKCNLVLNADPQISAGVDGQIVTFIGRYSDEAINLEDGKGLALANNQSIKLKAKDTITLMYSKGLNEWIEINRTNYLERNNENLKQNNCQ